MDACCVTLTQQASFRSCLGFRLLMGAGPAEGRDDLVVAMEMAAHGDPAHGVLTTPTPRGRTRGRARD
ncbi:unnamed protein product [Merluccius merluccius]